MPAQEQSLQPSKISFVSSIIPYIVLAIFAGLAVFAFVHFSQENLRFANERLHHEASVRTDQIQGKLARDIAVIRGVQGLFGASDSVDRKEFITYLDALQLEKNYPGIYSVVYGKKVKSVDMAAYEATVRGDTSVRKEGYPEFAVYPKTATDSAYVVTYVYPEETFLSDLGYMISSDPIKEEAIKQAMVIKGLAASGTVTLPNSESNIVLFVMPVNVGTSMEGVVLLRIHLSTVFAPFGAFDEERYRFYYRITEDNGKEELLVVTENIPTGYTIRTGLKQDFQIAIGEHTWNVTSYGPTHYGLTLFERLLPIIFTEVILGLGVFVFLLLYQATRAKHNAMNLANGMAEKMRIHMFTTLENINAEKLKSQKLAEDRQKFQLAVEHASDHIIITDVEGIIVYANQAVERVTGFSNAEVIGQKAGSKALWGGLMDKDVYVSFWKTIKEEKKVFIGEFKNHRKNGDEYIAEARVTPIIDRNGHVQFFAGIERDITHAKEVDRMKTEFISLASHQLRTPLSAMKWFSEMLLTGDAGPLTKEQKEYIGNIDQSNERMIVLVNSLLNITRIESGRIIVEPVLTDLDDLIRKVVRELQVKIDEKKLQLTMNIQEALPSILIDNKLIFEVYKNLLTNAIKYTHQGGTITIRITRQEDVIVSQVSDTGYGIPKTEQHRVFQRFYRGQNIVKLETEGTGLGLYLVQAIVVSSGGKIWFESEENKGTTFWFTLPMSGMKKKTGEVTITA